MNRRGVAIPLVVLILILLLMSGYTIVWQGTSDATQTGRVINRAQGEAAAQSAIEESILTLRKMFSQDVAGAGGGLGGDWRNQLLNKIEKGMSFSGDSIDPRAYKGVDLVVSPLTLPATQQALAAVNGRISVSQAHFSGFRPLVYPVDDMFRVKPAAKPAYYQEPVFNDSANNPQPRDFQGYVTTTVQVQIPSAFGTVTRTLSITRDVKIVDVTPPARDFALFSYGPPPDPNYINSDLNKGGMMSIFPNSAGRVLLRGPLFLDVEDAAAPNTALGDKIRANKSISYPEQGAGWDGWAFIPGPRAIRWPNFSWDLGQVVGILGKLFGGQGNPLAKDPVRPDKDSGPILLVGIMPDMRFTKWTGQALAGNVGIYLPIPPSESLAEAFSFAYLTGTVPRGAQKFSITGLTPEQFGGANGQNPTTLFQGIALDSKDDALGSYDPAVALNATSIVGNQPVEDQDAIMPEPFYYSGATAQAAGQTPAQSPSDHGVYGIYKIAQFNRYVFFAQDLVPVLHVIEFIPYVGQAATPAIEWITNTARVLFMDIPFVGGHWSVTAPDDLDPNKDDISKLPEDKIKNYFIAPWGIYFDAKQNSGLLNEVVGDAAVLAFTAITGKLIDVGMRKLFTPLTGPAKALTKSDLAGDEAATKVSGWFTGLGQDHPKVASILSWMTDKEGLGLGKMAYASGGTHYVQVAMVSRLMQNVAGGVLRGAAFAGLMTLFNKLRGNYLRAQLGGRNLGGTEASKTSVSEILKDFPKGLFPSKYRPYFRAATRSYATFDDYVAAQGGGNDLKLDDVILIKKLSYDHPERTFTYHGKGIIVALGDDGDQPILTPSFVPADAQSYLTLVYENSGTGASNPSVLVLGNQFQGSVYATFGVRPGGSRTVINGNLVCYNLNKSKIDASSDMRVFYDTKHLPRSVDTQAQGADANYPELRPWWVVSISPQVSATTESSE